MSEYCEKILAEARRMVGKETKIRWGMYPVEYEPIRRWCHMVNCLNPLYLDEEYAKKTKWGGVICPPFMIASFARRTPSTISASGPEIDWPPARPAEEEERIQPPAAGNHGIAMGGETEFLKVVRIGDRIGFNQRLVDVYIKKIRIDPEAFWIATDTIYVNQYLETVAISHVWRIKHRSRDDIAATTPEQLELIA